MLAIIKVFFDVESATSEEKEVYQRRLSNK